MPEINTLKNWAQRRTMTIVPVIINGERLFKDISFHPTAHDSDPKQMQQAIADHINEMHMFAREAMKWRK